MKIKKLLFILSLLFFATIFITACNANGGEELENEYLCYNSEQYHNASFPLDAENIVKIEHFAVGPIVEPIRDVRVAYTDETHILQLIDFFNSLILTPSEPQPVPITMMPEDFRIIFYDNTTAYISFNFMAITLNSSFFWITDNDRGRERSGELLNILYGLSDESMRLK